MTFRTNIKSDEESRLIQSVLLFASLREVTRGSQVYKIFDPFAVGGSVVRLREDDIVCGKIFEKDRKRLVSILLEITSNLKEARVKLAPKINELVIEKKAFCFPYVSTGGKLKTQIYGVEAGIFLAIALLLDPDRPFGMRLHLCGKTECNRWFITEHSRGGRPGRSRYCSKEHQIEQDNLNAPMRMKKRREKSRLGRRKSSTKRS